MFQKKTLKYLDFWIIIFMMALIIFGIVVIGSATRGNEYANYANYANKQFIGFIIGFILMLLVAFLNYELLKKLYIPIYLFNILSLIAVLKMGVGRGVARWIPVGSFAFQPSEFAKIFIIIFLAKFFDRKQEKINNPFVLILALVFVAIPTYLIKKQPDLSTSLILIAILVTSLYVSKINYKYILIAIIICIPLFKFITWDLYQPNPKLFKKYQVKRILSYLEPQKYVSNDAYQTLNSIQAIGSGQLEGKGLYKGTLNKLKYLPESHTDFIFSVVGEELGFIGCSIVLLLVFLIVLRCIWDARNAPDLFGTLVCSGVATLITFQTFIHVGVTTGILPNTGIPLPFVSYGLSSLWTNMIGIGLVLNVGMMRKSNLSRR